MINLPEDFNQLIKPKLGQEYSSFLDAIDGPPAVSIRLNPYKSVKVFNEGTKVPWHPDGIYLKERPSFTLDPLFHAGAYYVQEASSMLVYQALSQNCDLTEPLKVLDLCAAPGGKSTLLASMISEDSILVSNEVIKSRVKPLKMNMIKWGNFNNSISNHDVSDFNLLKGFFDIILVDAPCSGEGLFRKDEKAISEWSFDNVKHCALRQGRILKEASELLKEGGLLIYSTCTFNEFENEGNVKTLTEDGFDFLPLNLENEWGVTELKYGYQCYPHRVRGEGFFISVLRKNRDTKMARAKLADLNGLKKLGKKKTSIFTEWVEGNERYEFYQKPNDEIVAVPKNNIDWFRQVANSLKRRSVGVEIGQMKRDKFIPSHALALNNMVKKEVPFLELDKENALKYLKKENINPASNQMGWVVVKYEGLNLGWAKMLKGRVNNYFPTDWRIRIALK